MKNLINIKNLIIEDKSLLVSYGILIACFLTLIVASIVILRIDKLKLVLKFMYLFLKEKANPKDFENF